MPYRAAAVLPALLLAAGCLAAPAPAAAPASPPPSAGGRAVAAAPKLLKFGQAVRVKGEHGRPLRITPVGVFYHQPTSSGSIKPRNRYFLALAVRVTALAGAEQMPLPYGRQWRIRQGGRTFTTSTGRANMAPWIGRAQGASITVHKGTPEVVYEAFDVRARGGILEWSSPDGLHRWRIPAKNAGSATHAAIRDAIADYEGT
ncbi:hypothetical protein ACGFJC_47550 [Nonomuraea fuscirosea]|uniref:hypothetical protein n=1 Tax=Nonomuraea fuscirosea TaxID=1291556 RepID=UPI00371EE1A2